MSGWIKLVSLDSKLTKKAYLVIENLITNETKIELEVGVKLKVLVSNNQRRFKKNYQRKDNDYISCRFLRQAKYLRQRISYKSVFILPYLISLLHTLLGKT